MKHCPNPACSHLRAVGTAAEYVDDRATCSDCGAPLEPGPAPDRSETIAPIPPSLWARLAVTIAAVPMLGRFGARSDNATLLDRNYLVGWLVLAAVTTVVSGAVLLARGKRRP